MKSAVPVQSFILCLKPVPTQQESPIDFNLLVQSLISALVFHQFNVVTIPGSLCLLLLIGTFNNLLYD